MNIYHEKIVKPYGFNIKTEWSRSVPHWHQRMEIALVKEGQFRTTVQGNTYLASPGDLLVVNSGEIHYFQALDPKACMHIITFNPTLLQFPQSGPAFIRSHIAKGTLEESDLKNSVCALFSALNEEIHSDQKYRELMVISQLQLLYGMLARHFEVPPKNSRALIKFSDFQSVLSYIRSNYREHIDLEMVAKRLNYNASYVSAMFSTYTGVNYKTYLDSIRIAAACNLLHDTNETISDIATKCGFDNIRTFNNVFRRLMGVAPREFRKSPEIQKNFHNL